MRVGRQVSEAIRLHTDISGRAVTDKVVELLEQVHLPDPAALLRRYPHQLSGGQQQRDDRRRDGRPRALIADEPTTALDVTVQHEILRLLISLTAARDERLVRQPRSRRGSVCATGWRWSTVGRSSRSGASTTSSSGRGTGTPRRCSPRARRCPRTTTSNPSSDNGCRRSTGSSRRSGASQRMSFPQPLRARDGLVRRDPSAGDKR